MEGPKKSSSLPGGLDRKIQYPLTILSCVWRSWDSLLRINVIQSFGILFFVNDLVLFGKANRKNCQNIKDALDTFCELSGQKVNNSKSCVYFSPNVPKEEREVLYECLNLHSTPNLGKYLGIPFEDARINKSRV